MNYLPLLNEDEIRYICSVIPIRDAVDYFQFNPDEFAKIRPGFRATASSITKLNIASLLFSYRNRGFISFFIEKHIDDWLNQIQRHRNKCIEDGDSEETALLHTLPFCYFLENIPLYFKLTGEELSDDAITFLEAAVKELKEKSERIEAQRVDIESKETNIEQLNLKLESLNDLLDNTKRTLTHTEDEANHLRVKSREIEELKAIVQNKDIEIKQLREEDSKQNEALNKLKKELAESINTRGLLEQQIRCETEKHTASETRKQAVYAPPKRPCDMDEYLDYLTYNFESIGIAPNEAYLPLLKLHLSKVLFVGIPIFVNRYTGLPLMRCVSNALIGQPAVDILTYHEEITYEEIENYLSSTGRIACLDNFIGNYNETMLIPQFERHKGQIIFLTYSYDRTLNYVSMEFLRYGQHLNLNKIPNFNNMSELTEDPSIVEEAEYTWLAIMPDGRFSLILYEVLNDFGYPNCLAEKLCASVSNEDDLCRILAFDVLPYCIDVLHIAPYNTSDRLGKYAGANGRCRYKELFRRWFA